MDLETNKLKENLQNFDRLIDQLSKKNIIIKKGNDYWEANPNATNKSKKLISFLVHGNETISLNVLVNLLKQIEKYQYSFSFILGNRQSYLENKRFCQRDLNRSFNLKEHKLKEEKRAKEIEAIATNYEAIIDLHQTSYKTKSPFLLVRANKRSLNLSQYISNDLPLIYVTERNSSSEGDTFSNFALDKNIAFLTVELGEKGYQDKNFKLGNKVIDTFLKLDIKKLDNQERSPNEVYIHAKKVLKENENDFLKEGLQNLSLIKKNDTLYFKNATKEINVEEDFYILFPKYGEYQKFSKDLCILLKKKKYTEL